MKKDNIKQYIKKSRVYQWEIAKKLGYSETSFSRILRDSENLDEEFINRIKTAIADIRKEG